ncbi:hypothetical protein TWF281_006616 [Arthrobotrys megalospora]
MSSTWFTRSSRPPTSVPGASSPTTSCRNSHNGSNRSVISTEDDGDADYVPSESLGDERSTETTLSPRKHRRTASPPTPVSASRSPFRVLKLTPDRPASIPPSSYLKLCDIGMMLGLEASQLKLFSQAIGEAFSRRPYLLTLNHNQTSRDVKNEWCDEVSKLLTTCLDISVWEKLREHEANKVNYLVYKAAVLKKGSWGGNKRAAPYPADKDDSDGYDLNDSDTDIEPNHITDQLFRPKSPPWRARAEGNANSARKQTRAIRRGYQEVSPATNQRPLKVIERDPIYSSGRPRKTSRQSTAPEVANPRQHQQVPDPQAMHQAVNRNEDRLYNIILILLLFIFSFFAAIFGVLVFM